jgi:Holliday junction resolvase
MSPNKNYVAGRSFEYARKAAWEADGYDVIRAAGSHGVYDLVAFKRDKIVFIQCKLVEKGSQVIPLANEFVEKTPILYMRGVGQVLEVRVKGSKEVLRYWLP